MKTLALMLTTGTLYAIIGETTSQALHQLPLDSDSKFALFVIGLVVGVFTAKRLDWV